MQESFGTSGTFADSRRLLELVKDDSIFSDMPYHQFLVRNLQVGKPNRTKVPGFPLFGRCRPADELCASSARDKKGGGMPIEVEVLQITIVGGRGIGRPYSVAKGSPTGLSTSDCRDVFHRCTADDVQQASASIVTRFMTQFPLHLSISVPCLRCFS